MTKRVWLNLALVLQCHLIPGDKDQPVNNYSEIRSGSWAVLRRALPGLISFQKWGNSYNGKIHTMGLRPIPLVNLVL